MAKSKSKPLYTKADKQRFFPETDTSPAWRTPFRRDYARLVHSTALRRLTNKTQLFPGDESDFFRNRLTHSLEVAQIAKSIGQKINFEHAYFKKNNIDLDILEFAGLAHDLGHPPFGHIGERALDDYLKEYGGFEGNAQTLRILTTLEKKIKGDNSDNVGFDGKTDLRYGLNLTYRSLASIVKYDKEIPATRGQTAKLAKGYYTSEKALVQKIKDNVTGIKGYSGPFKTIECDIMDIADDIAYSTFDLEDTFKAEFMNPIKFIAMNPDILNKVHSKVIENKQLKDLTKHGMQLILTTFISQILRRENYPQLEGQDLNQNEWLLSAAGQFYHTSENINNVGYIRYMFTSALINEFIGGISVQLNDKIPALSYIKVDKQVKAKIECVKHFVFYSITMSNRLKIPEYRGYEIVNSILGILGSVDHNPGYEILPSDFRSIFDKKGNDDFHRKRTICDFVAGMTDKYVIEYYGRLKSESPQTIFKPT